MHSGRYRKLAIQTVGCRLNQYESERMAAQLAPYGFQRVMPSEQADLYIINTCTVTHRADSSCRNMIRKAVRRNPDAKVVVVGCYVDADPESLTSIDGVDLIIDNAHKDDIANILPKEFPELFANFTPATCTPIVSDFFEHNRAWVKVSDGCNQSCSYCIVTKVRGPLRNRPVSEVISDIDNLVAAGYKEVVLTGVHLGHYRHRTTEPPAKNLAALCRAILANTGLYRLRLSSIEPQTIRDELLEIYADKRICHHMHVPLQSGSNRILKMMRRPYTREYYLRRIEAVKKAASDTVIGADVIVGFPGETDEDFEMTRLAIESGVIDYLHVFSYSDRPGTLAADLPDKVRPDVIKKRHDILAELSAGLRHKAHQRQVGKELEVISEHLRNEQGGFWGVSGNYIKVALPGNRIWGKDVVRVKVDSADHDHVVAHVI
ncbi:MAG: tRNA (N(6)-L-threonylcarbamoyladenosine(37)-C(2))-methylthiotransferase MtaB [Candidatus Zixiibacteriota bacterium]